MKKKSKILVLLLILLIISTTVLISIGNTYTVEKTIYSDDVNIDNVIVNVETNHVKLLKKDFKDHKLLLTFEGLSKGKAFISINYNNEMMYEVLYVHNFNIITCNTYFGKANGDIVILLSALVFVGYSIYLLIIDYKKSIKKNIFQYRNISYLGLIIYLAIYFILQLSNIYNYGGLIDIVKSTVASSESFSILSLIPAFIVSIYVMVMNVVLMKREGITYRNMLGFILGIGYLFLLFLPGLMNNFIDKNALINLHDERNIWLYIERALEISIYSFVSYFGCLLLGTIVLSIKASKKIPKFNKDYIIILGCKTKKNGQVSNLLKSRVDRAIEFAKLQKEKTNKDLIFIPSGGKGNDERISEALSIKNYLVSQGIREKNILVEDKSTNTYENMKFSNALVKKGSNISFATSNYHVFRSGVTASKQNIKIEGIGAKTKPYYWINAFIREYVASIVDEYKNHLFVITVLIILSFITNILIYFSNIL